MACNLGRAESSGAPPSHHAVRGIIVRPHAALRYRIRLILNIHGDLLCHLRVTSALKLLLLPRVHNSLTLFTRRCRALYMMIVIYWNIKRIVPGVKTTLCEMKARLKAFLAEGIVEVSQRPMGASTRSM